ncbi:hypothetical protein [Nocardia rhamnosiphila]|uniref:Uncharacterized protein n=1 Tax=Nocardia rhamnosiphila TaxID=426716 RepID=A0ABV2WXR9_9NOCA
MGATSPAVFLEPGPRLAVGAPMVWASRDVEEPDAVVLRLIPFTPVADVVLGEVAVHWRNVATGASGTVWVHAGTASWVRVGAGPVLATTTSAQTLIAGGGVLAVK